MYSMIAPTQGGTPYATWRKWEYEQSISPLPQRHRHVHGKSEKIVTYNTMSMCHAICQSFFARAKCIRPRYIKIIRPKNMNDITRERERDR